MKRPVGVTILSVLALIGGSILVLSSLGYLGISALRTSILVGVVSGMSPMLVVSTGIVSLVLGGLAIAFGIGALGMKSWAWLTGMVVWSLSLVLGVVQLAVTGISVVPVLSVLFAIAILAYLASGSVRDAFGVEGGGHYTSHHPTAA
jgi:hypothetical protein